MALSFENEDKFEETFRIEDFILTDKEKRERAKEAKRRRKMYKFSDKDHSKLGIASSILALSSLILLITAIVVSTVYSGNGSWVVGLLCAVSFGGSLAGVVCGLLAFRNTEVFLKFAWIGMIANGIIWLITASLIVFGM